MLNDLWRIMALSAGFTALVLAIIVWRQRGSARVGVYFALYLGLLGISGMSDGITAMALVSTELPPWFQIARAINRTAELVGGIICIFFFLGIVNGKK